MYVLFATFKPVFVQCESPLQVENDAEVDDYFAHLNDYTNSEEEYIDID